MRHSAAALCLVPAVLLQGCAVSTPVRVSAVAESALPNAVALDLGKDATPALNAFAARFASALGEQGVSVRAGAPFKLTLALAAQSSWAGVTSDAGSNAKTVVWQSAPRRKGLFDGCTPERLRAVITGSAGLSANPPLLAEAELDTCKDRPAELARLATALAERLTRR